MTLEGLWAAKLSAQWRFGQGDDEVKFSQWRNGWALSTYQTLWETLPLHYPVQFPQPRIRSGQHVYVTLWWDWGPQKLAKIPVRGMKWSLKPKPVWLKISQRDEKNFNMQRNVESPSWLGCAAVTKNSWNSSDRFIFGVGHVSDRNIQNLHST